MTCMLKRAFPEAGVWEVENVLDAVYGESSGEYEPHTLSIEVRDVPGVLNQVSGGQPAGSSHLKI